MNSADFVKAEKAKKFWDANRTCSAVFTV